MARPPFVPNPRQAEALEAVGAARELERVALALAEAQGKRLWVETRDKYRPEVGRLVQEALDLGITKSHLKEALGSKSNNAIPRYIDAATKH
jgi:hypothetical protein